MLNSPCHAPSLFPLLNFCWELLNFSVWRTILLSSISSSFFFVAFKGNSLLLAIVYLVALTLFRLANFFCSFNLSVYCKSSSSPSTAYFEFSTLSHIVHGALYLCRRSLSTVKLVNLNPVTFSINYDFATFDIPSLKNGHGKNAAPTQHPMQQFDWEISKWSVIYLGLDKYAFWMLQILIIIQLLSIHYH